MVDSTTSAAKAHLATAGLGHIPSGWNVVEMADVLSSDRGISVGVMYPGEHDPNGVPLIKAGDLNGSVINTNPDFRISYAKHHEYSRTELKGGEIIMTLVGNVGQCAVVPQCMAGWNTARAVAVIRLEDGSDAHYVQQCLQSQPLRHLMDVWCNTTVQATLNLKEIRQLPLPWPPKRVRDAIANCAKAFDDKIELNRKMNATLEAMARALFQSWFVDFDPVRAKMDGRKPAGMDAETAALFPDSFEESELGLIPKGWAVGSIEDATSLIIDYRGKTPKKLGADWAVYGIPALSAKNVKNGRLVRSDSLNFVSEKLYASWMKDELAIGDVLMTSEAPLGELFYLALNSKYCLSQRLFALRANRARIVSPYLYFWLGTEASQSEIKNRGTGTTVEGIRQSELRKVRVLLPPLEIQNRALVLENSIVAIHHNEDQSRTLASLRDTLLPRLLSGELSVKHAEKIVGNVS